MLRILASTDPATLPIRTASHGGAFYFMSTSFSKPLSSVTQQITLLETRGLVIKNTALATHFLTHVGYYRLAGYWQAFQHDPVKHLFHPGTLFETIVNLYDFDRALRLLIFDAIERILNIMIECMASIHTLPHGRRCKFCPLELYLKYIVISVIPCPKKM
jgi:hypothetical protein